jgi:hypothetical protein
MLETVERFKKAPERYVVPWSMTLARPILGAMALAESRRGNWGTAEIEFLAACATDLEGFPARWLNATSKAGAIADPIADGILRVELLAALAPEMPKTVGTVTAIDVYNIKLNATVQKDRETPFIPWEAKWGTGLEFAGFVGACEGIRQENVQLRRAGGAAMIMGAGLRTHGYRKEYKRIESNDS